MISGGLDSLRCLDCPSPQGTHLSMISGDAPPFIILVFCTGMIAVLVALMNFFYNARFLFRPIYNARQFTFFHYFASIILGYLIAQMLGIMRILFTWTGLDIYIILILYVLKGAILSGMAWIYQSRFETPPLRP